MKKVKVCGHSVVGQFKKQKTNNLENNDSWYIILLVMISLSGIFIDNLIKSGIDNPWPAIGVIITILIILWGIIVGSRKLYLKSYPFVMNFCDKSPYSDGKVFRTKKKVIEGVHGLFPDKFVLDIYLKKELAFEQINIRFVKRKYFSCDYFTLRFLRPMFFDWEDARNEKIIRVEKINDLYIENSLKMATSRFGDENDSRGGRYGYYNPLQSCPKGSHLVYKVELYINPDIENRWDGYISFEHYRGGSCRSYTRRKITIRNISL